MNVHHYHENTFEYLGQSKADPDPLQPGKFLLPAHTTTVVPPALSANEAAIYDESLETWSVLEDHRNSEYWLPDRSHHIVAELGPLPAEALLSEPPLSVSDTAAVQMDALSTACRTHITGGVISDALGTPHTYPTDISIEHPDQQNLNGCVTESLLNGPEWTVPFWCADTSMVWDRRVHTGVQIQQVGMAVAAHVRAAQDLLKVAFDQIQAIVADPGLTDDQKRTAIIAIVW